MSGDTYDTVTVRFADNQEVEVGTPAGTDSLEGFIEEQSITTIDQAIAYGTQWLANHGTTVDQCDVGVIGVDAPLTPFLGLHKGDAVRVPDRTGTLETDRIHSIGFTGLQRGGVPLWSLTVGTRRQESLIADERRLAKLAGTMGGSFAASVPSPAPSFGDAVSGRLPTITLPLADADAFTTTAPYDRTAPVRFGEPTAIIRLQCQCESLVGSTDSIVKVYRITYVGAIPTAHLEHTFTWPGTRRLFQSLCDVSFAPNEAYQLRITQAGAHNLASIQPFGSSAN